MRGRSAYRTRASRSSGGASLDDILDTTSDDDGIVLLSRPDGEMLFVPPPAELDSASALLADEVITRLAR